MRTADRARRVVVTGVGMVSPLANGVRPSWERLIAGHSGIAPIQGFDPSDLPVKIAGEIPSGDDEGDFRPAEIVPTKDLRKMDDFIVYALALRWRRWRIPAGRPRTRRAWSGPA